MEAFAGTDLDISLVETQLRSKGGASDSAPLSPLLLLQRPLFLSLDLETPGASGCSPFPTERFVQAMLNSIRTTF